MHSKLHMKLSDLQLDTKQITGYERERDNPANITIHMQ